MTNKANKTKERKKSPEEGTWGELKRRFKANPFVFVGTIVILVIVIIAFVLVPAIVPEAGGAGVDLTFGSYNKIPITYVPGNYFAQAQENRARSLQAQGGSQLTAYQAWRDAFEDTVVHTAALEEARAAGYTAPASLVDRKVAEQFQENGRFSQALYDRLDKTAKLALWRETRDYLDEYRYRADVGDLPASAGEDTFISGLGKWTRSFDLAALPLSAYPESEVAAFVRDKPELFQVTHLSRITVSSSEEEAKKVLASVTEGTLTFEDAAKNNSKDAYAEKGGDMGLKMAFELATEVPDEEPRRQVTALARGGLSAVIKTPAGWAFFRAEEDSAPVSTGDSAMMGRVRSYLKEFERGRMEDYLIKEARSLIDLARETGFDEAVQGKGLEKKSFGPLPINYGGVDLLPRLSNFNVPELSGAAANDNFWRTAFFTPLKTPSEPVVVGDSVLVLYPTEENREAESAYAGYTSYWLSYVASQSIRSHFLSSDKLDDQFMGVFLKYFLAPN